MSSNMKAIILLLRHGTKEEIFNQDNVDLPVILDAAADELTTMERVLDYAKTVLSMESPPSEIKRMVIDQINEAMNKS